MAQALASSPFGSTGRWLTSFHHFQGVPRERAENLSVEEQQIILNVAKYFQEESKSGNKPQFRPGAVIAKTAAAKGVSKNSVRKIVSAGKLIDEGKTHKQRYDLESQIALMLESSEESFIICIGRIFLPV